jgi:UPF0716 protein FxsA
MIFLLLLFPFAEIYVLVKVVQRFGAVNTVFALLAFAVLGAGIARTQGRFIINNLRTTLAQGQMPTKNVLHGMFVFIGGLFFIFPGFLSKIVGAILVLPGSRHLVVAYVSQRLARKINTGQFTGQFKVFTFGAGMPGAQPYQPRPQQDWTRDVTPKIIDVTPKKPSQPE